MMRMAYGVWRVAYWVAAAGAIMDKTTIYLTDELRRELDGYVRRTGKRQSDIVREALGEYLARERPELPRSIGIISDGTIGADSIEEWLDANWGREFEKRRRRYDEWVHEQKSDDV